MNPREEQIIEIPSSPNWNPAATTGESYANIDYDSSSNSSCIFFCEDAVFLNFVLTLGLAVSVDPLFLYIPILNKDMKLDKKLTIVVLSLRSYTDIYYIRDIIVQLRAIRNAARYEAQAARREDGIAKGWSRRYVLAKKIWRSYLLNDILAIAPLPHVVILSFAKIMRGSRSIRMFLNFLLVLQYVTRVLHFDGFGKILEKEIAKTTPKIYIKGVFRFWIRSAFICFKFNLASHVFGAVWYFLSFQREIDCWKYACRSENGCELGGLDCNDKYIFRNFTLLNNLCHANPPTATLFDFGIFLDAIQSGILSSTDFPQKFLHCFWWGLRNLSSFGQSLLTSTYAWENLFAVSISVTGMIFVLICLNAILEMYIALSKGNRKLMETKEWRNPQIASWLDENGLPLYLKGKIMECALYELKEDEDIDIKNIHSILSWKDLVEIKCHLCLYILNKVSMLEHVNEKEFEAFCGYLDPVIYEADTFITREGDQFDKMLFITQGTVSTYTTRSDPGRASSSTGDTVGDECFQKGDFYGEELLQAWASTKRTFSCSTRNVRCCTKVEGFTLTIKGMERSREKIEAEKERERERE